MCDSATPLLQQRPLDYQTGKDGAVSRVEVEMLDTDGAPTGRRLTVDHNKRLSIRPGTREIGLYVSVDRVSSLRPFQPTPHLGSTRHKSRAPTKPQPLPPQSNLFANR